MRKATALSTHYRRNEDSLLLNAPWEEVGSTSERHYKQERIKLSRTCPFKRLERLIISKIHLFHKLEQNK